MTNQHADYDVVRPVQLYTYQNVDSTSNIKGVNGIG